MSSCCWTLYSFLNSLVVCRPWYPLPPRLSPSRCSRFRQIIPHPRTRRRAHARHLRRLPLFIVDERLRSPDPHGSSARSLRGIARGSGRCFHTEHDARSDGEWGWQRREGWKGEGGGQRRQREEEEVEGPAERCKYAEFERPAERSRRCGSR